MKAQYGGNARHEGAVATIIFFAAWIASFILLAMAEGGVTWGIVIVSFIVGVIACAITLWNYNH